MAEGFKSMKPPDWLSGRLLSVRRLVASPCPTSLEVSRGESSGSARALKSDFGRAPSFGPPAGSFPLSHLPRSESFSPPAGAPLRSFPLSHLPQSRAESSGSAPPSKSLAGSFPRSHLPRSEAEAAALGKQSCWGSRGKTCAVYVYVVLYSQSNDFLREISAFSTNLTTFWLFSS